MNKTQHKSASAELSLPAVDEILVCVDEKRSIARQYRRPYSSRKSKLERHRTIIMAMHQRGASLQDIVVALGSILSPRVDCVASTVKRFVDANDVDR